jgi:hypothetical protein
MRAARADEASIERALAQLPAPAPAPAIELDATGFEAAGLFLALSTQWRTAGLAGALTGLDYGAIRPTADLLGLALTPAHFTDLRLIEAGALKASAERARA